MDDFGLLIILELCFWGISQVAGLIVFSYSMFFWVGVSLRALNFDFLTWFSPSAWSVVPLVVLCCSPENIGGFNLAGCAIVYLMVSFLLWAYTILPSPVVRVCMHVGKNTLCLLLFSPIFTMLSRMYLPLFMFEQRAFALLCLRLCLLLPVVLLLLGAWTILRFPLVFLDRKRC